MTPIPTAVVVSILMASAVGALVLGVRPRRRTIAEVRSILQPSNLSVDRARDTSHRQAAGSGRSVGGSMSAPSRAHSRPISRLMRRPPESIVRPIVRPIVGTISRAIETSIGDGLQLIRRTADDVATRIVVASVALGFATLCMVASLMAVRVLPPSPWWMLLVIAAAVAGGTVMWGDTRSAVARRTREFRRTTADFIQMVAVGLTTDQSVEEAVQFALGVGESDLFDLLRDELATAPMRGVPLWEALDQLGQTFRQRELCEFAGSIERQGTQGVSITDTVNTLAAAMRAKALDELERDADRANANLSGPTIGFVVATMVFLAFPLAVRIGEAFGG